jgi:L-ascorbate metabolism protein UlaG (beta-lactamase superfamily)
MKHYFTTIGIIAQALLLFAMGVTPGTAQTADSLTYLCHAFVKIKTAGRTILYIDPYGKNAFKDSADIILVTHEHSDHNELSRVKQKSTCRIIRSTDALKNGVYQKFTIGSISITAVPAYNSNHPKANCVGYVVEFNNIKIYHAGDTGKIPEMAELASQNITYALLPMDGIYTMTPEVASDAAAMIQARYNIPIHTSVPPNPYSNAIVARFTSLNKMVIHPDSTIALLASTTVVGERSQQPSGFTLAQNYPNPFNSETSIRYTTFHEGHVSLKVYNVLGKQVAALIDHFQTAGMHQVKFNGRDLPSGIYFYRLQVNDFQQERKCFLLK